MDANEFLMSGAVRSAVFPNIGTIVSGEILSADLQQQRDFATGKPLFWDDGSPRNQLRVVLQTNEIDPEDPEDDGRRAIYLKSNMLNAVRDAAKKVGAAAKAPEIGAKLQVKYVADGKASQRGFNPPKLYEAQYRSPEPVTLADAEPVAVGHLDPNAEVPF